MRRAAFLIVVLAVFAAMVAAVTFRTLASDSSGGQGGWGGRTTPVAVHEVGVLEFADTVEALGTARANETVTITAKVADTISRINFDSGMEVEAGQILVEQTDLEESAGLTEARATLREARQDLARIRDLTERGVSAQSRLDEVAATVDRSEARVRALEARLADRIIRAPFSGVVGLREISLGELVRPGDIIASLDDTRLIKLDFSVPERFLSVIEPGMTIQAMTSAWPDETFTGVVAQIDSRIDPVTRTVTVRGEVPNEDGRIRPGQLMTVEVRRDAVANPAIPGSAITRYLDQTFVFVVETGDDGAHAVQREIEIGRRQDGMIEVVSGLQTGERVVGEGVHRIRDGNAVQVVGPEASTEDMTVAGSAASGTGAVQ